MAKSPQSYGQSCQYLWSNQIVGMTKAIVAIADFYAHAASPSIHKVTNFDSDFVGQELMLRI